MTTFGISMVRDEADIIGATVSRMQAEVDHLLIIDNGSTDGTRDILTCLGVEVIDEPDCAFHQEARMSWLAALAAERGAMWVVPFDADERWFSPHGRIADVLAGLAQTVVVAPWYEHVPTGLDGEGDPLERMQHRRPSPHTLPKVACCPVVPVRLIQGNHDAVYQHSTAVALEVRHFPWRSEDQMVRKVLNGVEAADAAGYPDTVLSHWRALHALGENGMRTHFRRQVLSRRAVGLVRDPCP